MQLTPTEKLLFGAAAVIIIGAILWFSWWLAGSEKMGPPR